MRASFVVTAALVLAGSASAACANGKPPQLGPSYSSTPCADNCGSDVQCRSACTPAGNNPPPSALMPHR